MRITNIRLKNLNSLTGVWDIDLTHSEYVSDGIFAITGPTGAGKTTILDAICLALYGRTPRLSRVTKSTNELMSRLTGDCFAEVVFETRTGRYRCQWSQHRARNRAAGELQAPRHEICWADSGELIESGLRETAEKIEILTGMDYERFTRSMLLAQGGFAAFLQAPANERAPILEQITGTEVYSRISVKVHERKAEEAGELKRLKESADGIQLLPDTVRQGLQSELDGKAALEPRLIEKRDNARAAIAWLEGIAQQEQKLRELQVRHVELEKQAALFKPQLEKLDRASRARELAGDYAKILARRADQNQETAELASSRAKLPAVRETLEKNQDEYRAVRELFSMAQDNQRREMPVIKAVRELDINIENKSQGISALHDGLAGLEGAWNETTNAILDIGIDLRHYRSDLEGIQEYLDDNAVDSSLIEDLAAIEQVFDNWRDIKTQYDETRNSLAGIEGYIEKTSAGLAEISLEYERTDLLTGQSAEKHEALQNTIGKLLEGRELDDWRNELRSFRERKDRLKRLNEYQRDIDEAELRLRETACRREGLEARQSVLIREIDSSENHHTRVEEKAGHLEIQLDLLKRIQGLEEQRIALEDGQPCPLCGSLHHPYALGNTPAPVETEAALKNARGELKTISQRLTDLKIEQIGIAKDLQQLDDQETTLTLGLDRKREDRADLLGQFDIQADDGLADNLLRASEDVAISIEKCAKLIGEVEQKRIEEQISLRELEQFNKDLADAEKRRGDCRHDLEIAERERRLTDEQYSAQKRRYNQIREQADLLVKRYGIAELSADNLQTCCDSLARRRDDWKGKLEQKAACEASVKDGEIELAAQEALHKKQNEELEAKQSELKSRSDDLNQLKLKRGTLFGDKDPDKREERLFDELQNADQALEKAKDCLHAAERELKKLEERIEVLCGSTENRGRELAEMEEAFSACLTRLGFADEAGYRDSCLDGPEYAELQDKADRLKKEQLGLRALLKDKTEALESERARNVTGQPSDELEQELSCLETDIISIREQIFDLKRRLKEDEGLRQSQQKVLEEISLQSKELERWNNLHILIGSADGKKYRNFVQGLTFRTMVAYANQQLSKMTDRYLLEADGSELLELNVIDNYQAGESRSTKNLSGGECFIVSLALALGLSRMASDNVRIDSFFLDEGFGSLDEYALDTALETLASLNQDGKTIGVISHVPALKERIAAQIEVIPQTGGRSIISGPGCRRINV